MMIISAFSLKRVLPAMPIHIDEAKCIGCMKCVDNCPIDLFMPSAQKGAKPIVAYPEECWYCGVCAMECPKDAIRLQHPLMNRPKWVAKTSLHEE
ncbi:4Fe-4S dicluster domain-containing protein [Fusibacter paucivorans]|nr:ferredoxin family protein [Fusibacter paucivorans]